MEAHILLLFFWTDVNVSIADYVVTGVDCLIKSHY